MNRQPTVYGFEQKAQELREDPELWVCELTLMDGFLTSNPHLDLANAAAGSLSARLRRGFMVVRKTAPPLVRIAAVPHPTNAFVARMHLADAPHARITVQSSRLLHAYFVSKAALQAGRFVESVVEKARMAFEDDPSYEFVYEAAVPEAMQNYRMAKHLNRLCRRAAQLLGYKVVFDPYRPVRVAVMRKA